MKINVYKEGTLESLVSSVSLAKGESICIQGILNDDDIAILGKILRKRSDIFDVDLSGVDNLTNIDHNAFEDCTNLASIALPPKLVTIGDHAFDGCVSLRSVVLPETVERIGDRAFSGCVDLFSINIPQCVSYIGVGAFHGCYGLSDMRVDKDNPRYNYTDGYLFDEVDKTLLKYFPGQEDVVNVVVPLTVTHIGNYAFDGCTHIEDVTINEGCTDIGERAFVGCEKLNKIFLPSTLNHITYNAFEACPNLMEFVVAPNNPNFSSEDGVLYNVDKSVLVIFPKAKKSPFEFPKTVTEIYDGAFFGCENIHSVIMPTKLNHIHNNAFNGCRELVFVNLPKSLKRIGAFAFADCSSLSEVWINSMVPPKCDTSPFASVDMDKCTLKVPIDAELTYRSEYGWDVFRHVEESFNLSLLSTFPAFRYCYSAIRKFFKFFINLFR